MQQGGMYALPTGSRPNIWNFASWNFGNVGSVSPCWRIGGGKGRAIGERGKDAGQGLRGVGSSEKEQLRAWGGGLRAERSTNAVE